jgi:hypothetical protein
MRRIVGFSLALAWFGFAVLRGALSAVAVSSRFNGFAISARAAAAPALVQLVHLGRGWFVPLLAALLVPSRDRASAVGTGRASERRGPAAGGGVARGLRRSPRSALAIDINGWTWPVLARIFGELPRRQPGLATGIRIRRRDARAAVQRSRAARVRQGNTFVAVAIGASIALVRLFTLYPLARLFLRAFLDSDGNVSLGRSRTPRREQQGLGRGRRRRTRSSSDC